MVAAHPSAVKHIIHAAPLTVRFAVDYNSGTS